MPHSVAIIGAGVSGLTCAVVFAERGHRVSIFAEEIGQDTTSGAAGAIWYPYDAEPADKVIPWALATYKVLLDLSSEPGSGVSMIELRAFCRAGEIAIPEWAHALNPQRLSVLPAEFKSGFALKVLLDLSSEPGSGVSMIELRTFCRAGEIAIPEWAHALNPQRLSVLPAEFKSGFALKVPLMDTTIYLDYLANRFVATGGEITGNVRLEALENVDQQFDLVINCSGIGARGLAHDADLKPHRGQVAIVPKCDLSCAIVCDDDPLMYAIPRTNDCLFGGTNDVSDNREIDPAITACIVAECSRVLDIDVPKVLDERVGLRPFRKSGVRLEGGRLRDGRAVVHNYGHGGSGFTLSWGCAENVFKLAD